MSIHIRRTPSLESLRVESPPLSDLLVVRELLLLVALCRRMRPHVYSGAGRARARARAGDMITERRRVKLRRNQRHQRVKPHRCSFEPRCACCACRCKVIFPPEAPLVKHRDGDGDGGGRSGLLLLLRHGRRRGEFDGAAFLSFSLLFGEMRTTRSRGRMDGWIGRKDDDVCLFVCLFVLNRDYRGLCVYVYVCVCDCKDCGIHDIIEGRNKEVGRRKMKRKKNIYEKREKQGKSSMEDDHR